MGRIIIADDDELVGRLASDALFAAGHGVGWVPDGISALHTIRARPPQLAILDWDMPGMPGAVVVREMRRDPDLAMIPIMMLTAITDPSSQRIAYFDGVDDYMTKPFDLDQLTARAEALLGGRKRGTNAYLLSA